MDIVLTVPNYTVSLPSNGKQVRIRPFLVKEEKILLIAAQGKDVHEMASATLQIVTNCLIDKDVKVENLPFFDVDYLFAAMRAKSISETVEVNFACDIVDSNGNKCGHIFPVELDITKATISAKSSTTKIPLSPTVGASMRYPNYTQMKIISEKKDELVKRMDLVKSCIEYLYDSETIRTVGQDLSEKDLDEFLDDLTISQMKKLEDWVNNLPYFEIVAERKCEKCGFEHKIKYKNVSSFFF